MAVSEEDAPKKKKAHEIGEDLAALSIEELNDRMALLKAEIARLEAAVEKKKASAAAAAAFFRT